MKTHIFVILAMGGLLAGGCNRQPRVIIETVPATPLPVARTETFETHALRREIDAYDRKPSAVQAAQVQKAFAEIDGEIAELVEYVAKHTGDERAKAERKLTDLRVYREGEKVRFAQLEARAPLQGRVEEPKGEGVGEKVGEKIDKTARKVEEGLRDAADAIHDRAR